jgi:hypothetical protein
LLGAPGTTDRNFGQHLQSCAATFQEADEPTWRCLKNHSIGALGIYYLLSAFIFGISGTLISVLIRIELYSSGNRIISPENHEASMNLTASHLECCGLMIS